MMLGAIAGAALNEAGEKTSSTGGGGGGARRLESAISKRYFFKKCPTKMEILHVFLLVAAAPLLPS